MAARVFQLSVLFAVVLLVGRSKGIELGLQFGVEPEDIVVSRNKPAQLQCSSPSPNVTFSWTLDDKTLSLVNNSRIQIATNGSLVFKKVYDKRKAGHGASDQGVYRCVLRSPVGALISRPALLRFPSMSHEFLEVSRNITLSQGDPLLLPCTIDSIPAAAISWLKDSQPLTSDSRYIILDDGTLIINQLHNEDKGIYSCVAVNTLLGRPARTGPPASVLVQPRPAAPAPLEILNPAPQQTALNWTLGANVTLVCVAQGSPPPLVKWTKQLLDLSSVLVSNVTEGVGILRIEKVAASHAGVYTCVASHDKKLTTVSVTKQVTVEQIFSPPIITKRPKSQEFPTAKTVRFQCEAEGNPPPEIIWYRDGYKLHINGRVKLRKELVVSNTVSNDSGVYQCVASNRVGVAWAAARLLVNVSRDQPRPPSRVSCRTVSASAVSLTWEQPSPPSQSAGPAPTVQAFTVHYLPTDGGEERMTVVEMVVGLVHQNVTVDKLPPYTNYTFYVRSYNNNAASDNSEEVVCQTGQSVPQGLPATRVTAQGAMTVLVEWDPLPPSVARGQVTQYKVQWRRTHHPTINVDQVPGDITTYVITGLIPNNEYEVRVQAATAKGWPSLAEHDMPWTSVKTPSHPSMSPLLPPPTVQLTAINSTTIQVRWTMVAESTAVDGFKLLYRKQNSAPNTPIHLLANASEYMLLGLEPQTRYEVQVQGVAGETEGEVGVKAIHTLPPLHNASPAPSLAPPTNLEASPASASAINLTWDPPPLPLNRSYFTISYLVVSSSPNDDSNSSFLHSTSNGVRVGGLRPYTLYQFKVRTHDHHNRHSEYSQTVECQTLEDVPGKVLEVQYKPLNTSSVRVMWKEPNVTNGNIVGYEVSYARQLKHPPEKWKNITLRDTRTFSNVSGLSPNTKYYLVVRGATAAGLGPPSEPREVYIPARERPHTSPAPTLAPAPAHTSSGNDQFLGVLLGCVIGGCCVILCMATLIYRRKCSAHAQCRTQRASNGAQCFHSTSEHHEMQCLPHHLDTKGGHANGEVNGLKLPLLSNGRLPNGLVSRERSVRITENPQFECSVTVSCEELRQPSDEGDSLLSGHSLNDTQLTTLNSHSHTHTQSPCGQDKHEPDDGFHESHQPLVGPNG